MSCDGGGGQFSPGSGSEPLGRSAQAICGAGSDASRLPSSQSWIRVGVPPIESDDASSKLSKTKRVQLPQSIGTPGAKPTSSSKLSSARRLAQKRAKKLKTVDLCFVIDITSSMDHVIANVSEKIEEIVAGIRNNIGSEGRVSVAIVGYRDYGDEEHPIVFPFSQDVRAIHSFIHGLKAQGGADVCEDILAGLEAALKLSWSGSTRILYLIAQTPNHGFRFHPGLRVCRDMECMQVELSGTSKHETFDLYKGDSREGAAIAKLMRSMDELRRGALIVNTYDLYSDDPRQWAPMDEALADLQRLQVQLICLEMDAPSDTARMFEVFKAKYETRSAECMKVKIMRMTRNADDFCHLISSSATYSFSDSVRRKVLSFTPVRSHAVRAENIENLPFVVKEHFPDDIWGAWQTWKCLKGDLVSYEMISLDQKCQKRTAEGSFYICPEPFSKGAMRFAFYIFEPSNGRSNSRKLVGKLYQAKSCQEKSIYEGDMTSQACAIFLARKFSEVYPEHPLQFVQAQLLLLEPCDDCAFQFMAIEPFIPGTYEKHTSNNGYVAPDSELAQAFSHWSYEYSESDVMVTDIQGVLPVLTDPQIHSDDVDRFGVGNLGTSGQDNFFINHKCNHICSALELPPHPLQSKAPVVSALSGGVESCRSPTSRLQSIREEAELQEADDVVPWSCNVTKRFYDQVRVDALGCLQKENATTDELGGATVKWTSVPLVVGVKEGTLACSLQLTAGVFFRSVGGQNCRGKPREEILKLLAADRNDIQAFHSPDAEGRGVPLSSHDYDPATGIRSGPLPFTDTRVMWFALPVKVNASDGSLELYDQDYNARVVNVFEVFGSRERPRRDQPVLNELTSNRDRLHPFACTACNFFPLVGTRFTCLTCDGMDFCETCYSGRGHSHSPGHAFVQREFAASTAEVAMPPPEIHPNEKVVVIRTGQADRDGRVGVVEGQAPNASDYWQISLLGQSGTFSVQAKHLFLLRSEDSQRYQKEDAGTLAALESTLGLLVRLVELSAQLKARSAKPEAATPALSSGAGDEVGLKTHPTPDLESGTVPSSPRPPLDAEPAPTVHPPPISRRLTPLPPRHTGSLPVHKAGLRFATPQRDRTGLDVRRPSVELGQPEDTHGNAFQKEFEFLCAGQCGRKVVMGNFEFVDRGQQAHCTRCAERAVAGGLHSSDNTDVKPSIE